MIMVFIWQWLSLYGPFSKGDEKYGLVVKFFWVENSNCSGTIVKKTLNLINL